MKRTVIFVPEVLLDDISGALDARRGETYAQFARDAFIHEVERRAQLGQKGAVPVPSLVSVAEQAVTALPSRDLASAVPDFLKRKPRHAEAPVEEEKPYFPPGWKEEYGR